MNPLLVQSMLAFGRLLKAHPEMAKPQGPASCVEHRQEYRPPEPCCGWCQARHLASQRHLDLLKQGFMKFRRA